MKIKMTTPKSKGRKPGSIKMNQKRSSGWKLDVNKITSWPTKASQRDVGQAPRHCDVPMASMGDKWVCPVCAHEIKKKK